MVDLRRNSMEKWRKKLYLNKKLASSMPKDIFICIYNKYIYIYIYIYIDR